MVLLRCSSFVLILWILIDTSGSNGDGGTSKCTCTSCPPETFCNLEPPKYCPPNSKDDVSVCKDPCANYNCSNGETCVAVDPSTGYTPTSSGGQTPLVPKCTNLCKPQGDPCFNSECNQVFGQRCYLNYTLTKNSCEVGTHCRSVCFGVQCPNCSQSCYPKSTKPFNAPFNSVPVCEAPCDSVNCSKGSECAFLHIGIVCQCFPCTPIPYCQATNGSSTPPPNSG